MDCWQLGDLVIGSALAAALRTLGVRVAFLESVCHSGVQSL